jgi:hypothetical protein
LRHALRQDSQRREAGWLLGNSTDQVRVGHQSQTAKSLGLQISDKLLAVADEVIE